MARMLSGRYCLAVAILLLLLCFPQGTSGAALTLAKFLGSLLKIGEFALNAVSTYEQLADNYRAKGLIKVDNFLNQSLTQCEVIETEGVTKSTIPITILPGYEEGFAAQQNEIGQGVEMIWSCRVTLPSGQKLRLFVQFKMRQQVVNRKTNNLGIAILEDNDGDLLEDERYKSLIGDSKPFDRTLQCATDDIAVQAKMSTSHQSEIDIHVYPKLVGNIMNGMQHNLTQRADTQIELDNILDFKQSCLSRSYTDKNQGLTTSIIYGIIGGVAVALCIVFCCFICKKCCCPSNSVGDR